MQVVTAMQGVVGCLVTDITSGVIVVHAGLLGTKIVLVVLEGDLVVAGFAEFTLVHGAHLAAADPGVVPGTVVGGIANGVIGNGLAIERRQLILPVGIAVGKGVGLDNRANGACGEGIRRLALNVATLIVGILPGGTSGAGRGIIRVVHTGQLAQQIVLIGDGLGAIADAGDIASIVVGIGQRGAGRGDGLYQRRGAVGAMTASQIAIGCGNASDASIDSAAGDTTQTVIDIAHLTRTAEVEQRRAVLIVMGEDRNSGASEEAPPMLSWNSVQKSSGLLTKILMTVIHNLQ